jgi:hypothetical protein
MTKFSLKLVQVPTHAHPKKEGYTKPFTEASKFKGEKGRKGEK